MIWFKGLIIELKNISDKMHQNVESQSCAYMKIPLNEGRPQGQEMDMVKEW